VDKDLNLRPVNLDLRPVDLDLTISESEDLDLEEEDLDLPLLTPSLVLTTRKSREVLSTTGYIASCDHLTDARFKSTVISGGHTLHTNCSSFYLPQRDGCES